jgi:hypothetical protein
VPYIGRWMDVGDVTRNRYPESTLYIQFLFSLDLVRNPPANFRILNSLAISVDLEVNSFE